MSGTQSFIGALNPVIVAGGATVSRTIDAYGECADAVAITIQAPSSLDTATFSFEVSNSVPGVAAVFTTLHDGSGDIAPPAAGKGRQYVELCGWRYWRIKFSSAAAADRTYLVSKIFTA